MCRKLLYQNYRVEYEDFGRLHFVNGDDWRIQVENFEYAKKLYEQIENEFTQLVEDLSDGLWIDLSRLEVVGKQLWFSRQYFTDFKQVVF